METETLTWRTLTAEDAPALTRFYAAVEAVDDTGEHYSEQDVRDELTDESLDLDRDTLAALTADGEFVGWAGVSSTVEVRELDRVFADGMVLPAARGRGVGRRLLEWSERRAAELHRERHPDLPGAVCVSVHENIPTKQALVRAAGFEATRWWHTMARDLDGELPPIPDIPPGLQLVPYTPERDEAVRQAHREAFAGHWGSTPPDEQRWAHWYTGAQTFRADVSHLVLDGDEVAAYCLAYFWEADAAATGVRDAYIGQIGVRPAWRQRGLGSLLLAAALRSYAAAGYGRSSLTVDSDNATGALGLYERAGYEVKDTRVTWSKLLG